MNHWESDHTAVADILTPLAITILQCGRQNGYSQLVVKGHGSADAGRLLESVRGEQLLARPVVNPEAASALLAGLWLWHDRLDESHRLSQSLVSASGSFWHAIMHRREGDFPNAKYWYARCRTHPALRVIAVGAASILGAPDGSTPRDKQPNGWEPNLFVDWVEQIYEHPADPTYPAAVELQRLEWKTLFADCAFAAVGIGSVLGGGIE